MTSTSELKIAVQEWPGRNELAEFLHQPNAHEEIKTFITEEFDTLIHFKVGEVDLLAGYEEAFFLPLHAFLRSLSSGVKLLEEGGEARFPIYLQQYAVSEGDAAHHMSLRADDDDLFIKLEWGGEVDAPAVINELGELQVSKKVFREEVANLLDLYARKVAMLLGHLPDWEGAQISALFSDF